jgi:hypothetical protein
VAAAKSGTVGRGDSDGGSRGGRPVSAGTTAADGVDCGPVPALFVAMTVNV